MRAVAIVGIAVTLSLAAAAQQKYEILETWAQIPGGRLPEWELARVAASRDGKHVYVFRRSDPPLVELDQNGRIVRMWGEGLFAWPHGLHVDREGNIWATDATVGP